LEDLEVQAAEADKIGYSAGHQGLLKVLLLQGSNVANGWHAKLLWLGDGGNSSNKQQEQPQGARFEKTSCAD
jgi:hypothetical protein